MNNTPGLVNNHGIGDCSNMGNILLISEKKYIPAQLQEVANEEKHNILLTEEISTAEKYLNEKKDIVGIFFNVTSFSKLYYDLYNNIKQNPAYKSIPVTIITPDAKKFQEHFQKTLYKPRLKFIVSPIKKAELRSLMYEIKRKKDKSKQDNINNTLPAILMENIDSIIVLTDQKFNILWNNAKFIDILKLTKENINSKKLLDWIIVDELERKNITEVFDIYFEAKRKVFEFITKHFINITPELVITWKSTIVYDNDMEVKYIIIVGDDITVKAKLERELEQMAIDIKISNIELSNVNEQLNNKNDLLATLNNRNMALNQLIQQYTPKSTWQKAVQITDAGLIDMPEEELEMTMMHGDIQNFTRFAELRTPVQVINQLREVFKIITEQIYKFGGDVDKFVGDAFLAVFEKPIDAIEAALNINTYLDSFNDERMVQGTAPLFFRIGINTGQVIRGNVGGNFRKDYTIIGDAVNIAQRLESEATPGQIMISEKTYEHISDKYVFSEPEELKLRGRTGIIKTYYIEGRPEDFINA